jgi:polar amino acid transport system ATP-binding protein
LLCDESTSGLDIATTGEVVSFLKSVGLKQMAMIIASHGWDFLMHIAGRICLIENSQIIAHMIVKDLKGPIGYARALREIEARSFTLSVGPRSRRTHFSAEYSNCF